MFYLVALVINAFVYQLCTVNAEHIDFGIDKDGKNNIRYLQEISEIELIQFVQMGIESIEKENRYEAILQQSKVTIQNGTLSHIQLLDTLPTKTALNDSIVATKIVRASQNIYNGKCVQAQISKENCVNFLSLTSLPKNTMLYEECKTISNDKRDGHHKYRRILPANYSDGIYMMYYEEKLPLPRYISTKFIAKNSRISRDEYLDENLNNLALVQWAQFIEHDISKPVSTSMVNGLPIECCNKNNYKQQPRHLHIQCAPIIEKSSRRSICLNYVRSALAVEPKCNFGAAEQLNQASGVFDLSQLYGFTENASHNLRLYEEGLIKYSASQILHQSLLPQADNASAEFCAFKTNDVRYNCFMAADSRVNNSPFTLLIYTLFLRNHNQIARFLLSKHPNWNDDQLFHTAKAINSQIYRQIIYNHWLPNALDLDSSSVVPPNINVHNLHPNDVEVSNEFAVAAIRFYFSMMPNQLKHSNHEYYGSPENNFVSTLSFFNYSNEIFTPNINYSVPTLNNLLNSILKQRVMKMDGLYEETYIPRRFNGTRPSHADILAFDIQRGRDHGIRAYVEYLELCTRVTIKSWTDLETFIPNENILKLKGIYNDITEIDLIVGGICERPQNNSVVGPTFNCILVEQFGKILEWQNMNDEFKDFKEDLLDFNNFTAVEFLCSNSDLEFVPENIFKISSERNKLMSCKDNIRFNRVSDIQN